MQAAHRPPSSEGHPTCCLLSSKKPPLSSKEAAIVAVPLLFITRIRCNGRSRGAFDPNALRAHFTAPRAKPFQPKGLLSWARRETATLPASLHPLQSQFAFSISYCAQKSSGAAISARQTAPLRRHRAGTRRTRAAASPCPCARQGAPPRPRSPHPQARTTLPPCPRPARF